MGVFSLQNETFQFVRFDDLSKFWQASQEAIQCLLILVAFAKVILEVRVELITILHDLLRFRVGRDSILKLIVKLFYIPLELFLETFSETISLLPNLKLGLEVCKALSYGFHIKNTLQTFL